MRLPTTLLVFALSACSTTEDPAGVPDAGGTTDAPAGSATAAIPQPTGTCPTIVDGDVMFAPSGLAPRKVKLALATGAQRRSSSTGTPPEAHRWKPRMRSAARSTL